MPAKLNPIQSDILIELMRTGEARFALLNAKKYPSDQFSYHLRYMVQKKLVHKSDEGIYTLSPKGAGMAVLVQPSSKKLLEQGFVAIRTVIVRKNERREEEYLVQRRTKSPYRGYLSTPGGKILLGESLLDAASSVLKYETGLEATLEPKGMLHLIDDLGDGELLDKFFFVIRGDNPIGELHESGETGTNIWMTYQEIVADAQRHGGLIELIDTITGKHPWFGEYRF